MSRSTLAALVALGLLAVLFAVSVRSGDEVDPSVELAVIADVAGRFGEALFTYDADTLDAARETLAELGTERVSELYERTLDEGLAGTIGEAGGRASAEAREVFVGPLVDGTSSAIVVVDAEITGTGGLRTIDGLYLRLELLRDDAGAWRVDELTVLTAEQADLS